MSRETPSAPADSLFAIGARDEAGARLILLVWGTTALFALGTAVVAAIAWALVPPHVFTEAFNARFCLPPFFFYAGQPGKNAGYLAACAAAPLLLPAACFAARKGVACLPASRLSFYLRVAAVGSLAYFTWCVSAIGFTTVPALEGMPPDWLTYKWFFIKQPFFTWGRLLAVAGAFGLAFYFRRRVASAANRNLALAVLLVLFLILLPFDFYAPAEIDESWPFDIHFNPLVYALGQAVGGRHFLVDFSHMYGGWFEFLAPLLALAPHRPETFLIAFGLLKMTGAIALLLAARMVIASPFHLLLAGCALFGILDIGLSDNYYQNSAVRMLFPAVGLASALLYLRRPRAATYLATSLLAAVASPWNLDTGLVLWLSWTLTLLAREWSEGRARRIPAMFLTQAGFLVAAWACFGLYLRLVSGRWPDAALLFSFQGVYAGSGFLCVGLLVPDVWLLVLAVYAASLATVAVCVFRRIHSWKIHALLLLALLGLGLFIYFMGRSCEGNLVAVSWPVPLILGLVLSEAGQLVAQGKIPRAVRALLLPAWFVQGWWAFLFALAFSNLAGQSVARLEAWRQPVATTLFGQNVAFVQSHTAPRERLLILSNEGGFYHYLSGTLDATGLPSTAEWLFSAQVDGLLASLDARQIPKLVIDQDFFDVEYYNHAIYPRLNDALARNYRLIATSPTGQLKLYVPRDPP